MLLRVRLSIFGGEFFYRHYFRLLFRLHAISITTMKIRTTFAVSRPALLTLTYMFILAFTACVGDDDNETAIDELLSEETTPLNFEFDDFEYLDKYFLFDYAGNKYIGSDTLTTSKCTLDLRQGKHHLIWMKGQYGSDVGFIPQNRTFSGHTANINVTYTEMDIEVSPYLMPVKKVTLQNINQFEGNTSLTVMVTDIEKIDIKTSKEIKVTGFPFMNNISLDGNNYEIEKEIYTNWVHFISGKEDIVGIYLYTLCPTAAIENIQIKVEVQDAKGKPIPTTTLPMISLQRGCTTDLRGPLFSGNTSDWTVTMEPDKYEY